MAKQWSGERLETFVFNESSIEHLHRYAIAREYVKGKEVLDIACGEGYGASLLAACAKQVTAVDIDLPSIENARKRYRSENLRFLPGSVENIPLNDRAVDVVISLETIEHVAGHEQMLREIKRVLRPDGLLFISTPEKKNYSDIPHYHNPYHVKELYAREFRQLIARYFTNVAMFYQAGAYSSVVSSDKPGVIEIYAGDFSAIRKKSNEDAVYLIALAADQPVEPPSSSIFMGNVILQQAVAQKEADIKGSVSYRLGHFLLTPFKIFRSLFR